MRKSRDISILGEKINEEEFKIYSDEVKLDDKLDDVQDTFAKLNDLDNVLFSVIDYGEQKKKGKEKDKCNVKK